MVPPASEGNRRALPRNPETRMHEADNYRATLHHSELALVEDSSVSSFGPAPSGFEPQYQIGLPYFGFFAYEVGSRRWLIDANRTLFASPGWEFQDHHPVAGVGHATILINPARPLLDEICGGLGPNKCGAFIDVSRPSTMRLHLLIQHMLRLAPEANDPLHNDEWVVHALDEAINGAAPKAGRQSKVVDHAKEVLHGRVCERLSLQQIAREVGVTPVYLTQEFTRSEGTPLYRYQLRLRLGRSLLELPHCEDITGLALDLGFSSHSHFTAAFGKTFGMTPSEYRQRVGTRQLRLDKQQAQRGKLRAA